MLKGFEKETHELSDQERKLLPLFIAGFKNKIGKENSITNRQIVLNLRNHNPQPILVSEVRVRKIINFIRNENLVEGLIATSSGYYISKNDVEVEIYIESLAGRINEISRIKKSFEAYLAKIKVCIN